MSKLLVAVAADADWRSGIADEIDLHQIILVWQRGERLIDRTAQDSKREFAINNGLDARLGTLQQADTQLVDVVTVLRVALWPAVVQAGALQLSSP